MKITLNIDDTLLADLKRPAKNDFSKHNICVVATRPAVLSMITAAISMHLCNCSALDISY